MLEKNFLNPRLQFGNDLFYLKLQKEIPLANVDSRIYYELYSNIENDVKPRLLCARDLADEYGDLLNEIVFSVIKGLPRFLHNPDFFSMSEEQIQECQRTNPDFVPPEIRRQKWLDTIVDRRISDFRKKKIKEQKWLDYEEGENEAAYYSNTGGHLDSDSEDNYQLNGTLYEKAWRDNPENKTIQKEPSDALVDRLIRLFEINTKPERIIGFVYSVIIIPLAMSKEEKGGRPHIAESMLQGCRMYDLFCDMKKDLNTVLDKNLPEYIFKPLEDRIEEKYGSSKYSVHFEMTAEQIMYATNYIKKKAGLSIRPIKSKTDKKEESDEKGGEHNGSFDI